MYIAIINATATYIICITYLVPMIIYTRPVSMKQHKPYTYDAIATCATLLKI